MRVVFAGTPAFAVPSLLALLAADSVDCVGVYTQPDRPRGRGRNLLASPLKQFARLHELPLFQPESFDRAAIAQLEGLRPDLMVVVAFGLHLPDSVLAIPSLGCVNIHPSLLPRWRGAAPVERAIEAGDAVTGVTLMQMNLDLDGGPVLASESIPIAADDTGGSLRDKLARLGGQLLAANLPAIAARSLEGTPQDESRVCYAHKLEKAEARLDWLLDAATLERRVRAFNPWPVATTDLDGLRIRVLRACAEHTAAKVAPGEIVRVDKSGIAVATGTGAGTGAGALVLREVQKPGGAPMPVAALLNGMHIAPGMRFALPQREPQRHRH